MVKRQIPSPLMQPGRATRAWHCHVHDARATRAVRIRDLAPNQGGDNDQSDAG